MIDPADATMAAMRMLGFRQGKVHTTRPASGMPGMLTARPPILGKLSDDATCKIPVLV